MFSQQQLFNLFTQLYKNETLWNAYKTTQLVQRQVKFGALMVWVRRGGASESISGADPPCLLIIPFAGSFVCASSHAESTLSLHEAHSHLGPVSLKAAEPECEITDAVPCPPSFPVGLGSQKTVRG